MNKEALLRMPIKIAMIGVGLIGFTRTLMHDILSVPELAATTFALTHILAPNLDMVTQLCRREIAASKLPATIVATQDRRAAIAESDYVISTIRQGGLAAFQTDIDIPRPFGTC
jgi:alpha-galactosidase